MKKNRIILIIAIFSEAACAMAQTASDSRYLQLADSAQYYISKEQWDESARCIRDALRLEPANVGNVMLFSNLGLASGMAGKYGEAMQCFDIALQRAPNNTHILSSKARIQILAADNEGAAGTLDRILELDSLSQWARQTRGLMRLRAQDYRGAHDDFMFLTRKFPADTWGPGGLAKCMEAQGLFAEAAGYYRDAIGRCRPGDSDRIEFELGLIENLGHQGRLQEALDSVKEALADNPHEGRLYLLRGWIKEKLLIYREAEADRKLAIEYGVDPQTVEHFIPARR